MKPAAFDYHRVDRVEDAVARLAELGEDAKVLAGGQSLVPMMNFRLVRPPALVDITRIPDLRYIGRDGDVLRVGALTLHREIETLADPEIVRGYELLPRAARWVGHYPIRTRGTFGGSVAHADPSAEWCMLAVLLDATIVVTGPAGEREIPAAEFFLGFFTTALEPGELLVEVKLPAAKGWKSAYYEVRERQAFDWPLVSAAIAIKAEGGVVTDARVVLGQVAPVPWRSQAAEKALVGKAVGAASAEAAGKAAVEGAQPMTDNGYKVDLVTTLVRRTVATLA